VTTFVLSCFLQVGLLCFKLSKFIRGKTKTNSMLSKKTDDRSIASHLIV